jgi:hypothetical protein
MGGNSSLLCRRSKRRKAGGLVSASAIPETTKNQLFKKLRHSRIYDEYLASKIAPKAVAAGKHGNLLDAWFGLCDEFIAANHLADEAMPVLWDWLTKSSEVFSVSRVLLNKLDEGYVLIGFATIGVNHEVLRAMPLPIFTAYEAPIVTEAILQAKV